MRKKHLIKNGSDFFIEPEEVLLDAVIHQDPANPRAYLEKRLETFISTRKSAFIAAMFLAGVILLLGRAVQLQVAERQNWTVLAEKNRSRLFPLPAQRGIIYDRNLKPLVKNVPKFDVAVIPELLPAETANREQIFQKIAEIFSSDQAEVLSRLRSIDFDSSDPALIIQDINQEQLVKLEALLPELPGIRVERDFRRQYLFSSSTAHILGYVGLVSSQDLRANSEKLFRTDTVGKSGLELVYDQELRGVSGKRRFEVASDRSIKNEAVVSEPEAGQNIVTTIDSELQERLYQEVGETVMALDTGRGGAAVALNPQNGEVLALVSWPGFDNNLFSKNISASDYLKLSNDPRQPLFNRSISGQYPPGSSFKPFVATAALQEGVITPEREIFDKGYIALANPFQPGQMAIFPDWKAHGWVNLEKALAFSANVYFYIIGGGYQDISGLGVDRIKQYAQMFGFGEPTKIDLPFEASGFLPDEQWKAAKKPEDPVWRLGDTYHISIGQGEVLTTPLQLAFALGAIANGGTVYKPRLLEAILDQDLNPIVKSEPEIIRRDFAGKQAFEEVKKGMKGTNTYGTARSLSLLSVDSGGKTGTAQFGPQNRYTHGWYSVFAPFERPEIALVVLIEGGGEGSVVSVPIARKVLEWYFGGRLAMTTTSTSSVVHN